MDLTDSASEPTVVLDPNGSGSIGISNLSMMVNINAITELDSDAPYSPGRDVLYDYANDTGCCQMAPTLSLMPKLTLRTLRIMTFKARALTIDAGTCPILSAGMNNNYSNLGERWRHGWCPDRPADTRNCSDRIDI